MFSNFKNMISDFADQSATMFARVTNKKTFDRVVFASFLIARADGNFDASEKTGLAKVINKDFPQFKLTDIIDTLGVADAKIAFDETLGELELIDEIKKASGEDAELIVRTACFIGAADGDFDDDEKAVASKIASALGLSPAAYGL